MNKFSRHGFSLVELSIVLVILGLLVGGVLAGQTLIRAAEMRDITVSAERYRVSSYAFRDKYLAYPGDITNATAFWGTLAGTGNDATCANTEATGSPTCNGNGDTAVDTSDSGINYDERFRFWQHLANAGMVEGRYTGRTDSATPGTFVMTNGKNMPAIKGGGTYDVYTFRASTHTYTANGFAFTFHAMLGKTVFSFRGPNGTPNPLTPTEQWNIDTKLDDGRPAYGILSGPQRSWVGSPNCTTSDDPVTATYDLTATAKLCRFNLAVF